MEVVSGGEYIMGEIAEAEAWQWERKGKYLEGKGRCPE